MIDNNVIIENKTQLEERIAKPEKKLTITDDMKKSYFSILSSTERDTKRWLDMVKNQKMKH